MNKDHIASAISSLAEDLGSLLENAKGLARGKTHAIVTCWTLQRTELKAGDLYVVIEGVYMLFSSYSFITICY